MPKVCRSCCSAPAPCANVCAIATDCVDFHAIYDGTLTLFQGATVLGSCTTTVGEVGQIAVVSGGSGYTSAPTVTISGGGGTGAVFTAVVNGFTHTVTGFTAVSRGSGYTSAPTVTLAGGGGTGASATARIGGSCCIGVTTSMTGLHYTVTRAGYTTFTSGTFSVTCGTDHIDPVSLVRTTTTNCSTATGCGLSGQIDGVTISATQGGVVVGSGVTGGGSHQACFDVAPGAYTYTGSLARLTFNTLSATAASCTPNTVAGLTGSAASGYHCVNFPVGFGGSCPLPLADTLTLTDGVYGATTLTWAAAGPNGAGWYGSASVTVPACVAYPCTAGGVAATVAYFFDGATLSYLFSSASACVNGQGGASGPSTAVCPPSFLWQTSVGGPGFAVYCDAAASITITE